MTRHLAAACLLGALLAGCSGGEAPESAFKAQTDALTKAEDANRAIEAAAAAQRQVIDEQGH